MLMSFLVRYLEKLKQEKMRERKADRQREKASVAALIDFSCNLLTNSSPDISLSPSLHL